MRIERHDTCVYFQIYFNNRDLTYVLLSHGADVNVLDVNNKSLLHLAAKQGCPVDIVVMILRRMLPNIVQALDKQQCSALHWACYRDYRISKHFLQRKLFDTMVGNAFSPLHCAA